MTISVQGEFSGFQTPVPAPPTLEEQLKDTPLGPILPLIRAQRDVQETIPIVPAFRQDNEITSIYRYLRDRTGFEPEPGYDPLPDIQGTKYLDEHGDRFVMSRSRAETLAIKREIDTEEEDKRILAASGMAGIVAGIGAGLASPVMLMPGGAIYRVGRTGANILRSAATVGAAGGAAALVSEGILGATQTNRTPGEMAVNVATGTILSALIGGGASALLSRGERAALEDALHADRQAWANDLNGVAPAAASALPPVPPGHVRFFHGGMNPTAGGSRWAAPSFEYARDYRGGPNEVHYVDIPVGDPTEIAARAWDDVLDAGTNMVGRYTNIELPEQWAKRLRLAPSAATQAGGTSGFAPGGAAVSDTRELELREFGQSATGAIGRIPIVGPILSVPGKMLRAVGSTPTTRTFLKPFKSGRRTMADLAETSLEFEENKGFRPTTSGATLSRLVQMKKDQARVALGDEFDRLYMEYRYGQPNTNLLGQMIGKARAYKENLLGQSDLLTPSQFREEVGRAMNRGDTHEIPQVQQAAQWQRANIFDPWKERMIKAGVLDEDVDPKTAASYFHRVYNKEKIIAQRPEVQRVITDWLESEQRHNAGVQERLTDLAEKFDETKMRLEEAQAAGEAEAVGRLQEQHDALRTQIEDEIRRWHGKSALEAVRALQKRDEKMAARPEGAKRLKGADKPVAKALKKLLKADKEQSREALHARAGEIIDRILGTPDGRLPYDAPGSGWAKAIPGERPRGPLAPRLFLIRDELIEPWLEKDAALVADHYLRTVIPDTLLTERFGDVRMTDAFKKLREEHEAMANAAATEAERKTLRKQYDEAVKDIAGVRDRIRHVYGWSADPMSRQAGRIAASVTKYDYVTNGGGFAMTSIPDAAGAVFRFGLSSVLRHSFVPFVNRMERLGPDSAAYRVAKRQLRAMGIGIDTVLHTRVNAFNDLMDMYRPVSRLERTLDVGANAFGQASGLNLWTDNVKVFTGMTVMSEIMWAVKKAVAGTATKKQITSLAASGIDSNTARLIWEEFNREGGGNVIQGVWIPNTGNWQNEFARDAMEAAINREVDIAVITPGQEKPLWLSTPLGAVVGQYKSFVAAATERLLIANLQRHDFQSLQGLIAAVGLGMLTAKLYSVATGQSGPQKPQDWLKEGIYRSGVLGWVDEGNAVAAKWTGGTMDMYRLIGANKPISRYQSRSLLSSLMGPTAGKIETISQLGYDAAHDWTWRDTHMVRRLTPAQNLPGLRRVLDRVEGSINDALGIPSQPPQSYVGR